MNDILDVIGNNPPDRCYLCKREIFSVLRNFSEAHGYVLTDGTNADDMKDYRPGIKALTELDILSPLKEAGLTKQEIRALLRKLGEEDPSVKRALYVRAESGSLLPVWEKPAFACLASRIPYGEHISAEKLSAIYRAELFLKSLGFTQVRVRCHGDVARIEVPPEERSRFFDEGFMDMVNEHIKGCGFTFAALDLGGYRMGSLNPSGIKHSGR